MTTPTRYYFTLSTDLDEGTCSLYLQMYDIHHEPVGPAYTSAWTTFCWTWQDLVLWIEKRFTENGGVLNESLHRPSPFVDLT